MTQVTRWYLDRIHRYNGIYRDIETLDEVRALTTAARLDKEGPGEQPPPLWGVPIVVVPGGFYPSGLPFGLEVSVRSRASLGDARYR